MKGVDFLLRAGEFASELEHPRRKSRRRLFAGDGRLGCLRYHHGCPAGTLPNPDLTTLKPNKSQHLMSSRFMSCLPLWYEAASVCRKPA